MDTQSPKTKAEKLFSSICELNRLTEDMERLLLRIQIKDTKERPPLEPDPPAPSLSTLLDKGPEDIDEQVNQCKTIIEQIEQALF